MRAAVAAAAGQTLCARAFGSCSATFLHRMQLRTVAAELFQQAIVPPDSNSCDFWGNAEHNLWVANGTQCQQWQHHSLHSLIFLCFTFITPAAAPSCN